MFSLFKYVFSRSIVSGSDEVLIISATIYFLIPERVIKITIFNKEVVNQHTGLQKYNQRI